MTQPQEYACFDSVDEHGVIPGPCGQRDAQVVTIDPGATYSFNSSIKIPKTLKAGRYSLSFSYMYPPTDKDRQKGVFDCQLDSNEARLRVVAN